jgi:hypothetical protein
MPSPSTTIVALQGAFNLSIGVATLLFRSVAKNSCEVLAVDSIPSIHAIGLLDINFGYVVCFIFYFTIRVFWGDTLRKLGFGLADNELDRALLLNAAYRKDRSAMWMLVVGRLLAIPVFLLDGGPWVNLAAFDGACGVLTAMALGWEVYVSSLFIFLLCGVRWFRLIETFWVLVKVEN